MGGRGEGGGHMKFCQQWSCLAFRILALTTGSCAFSSLKEKRSNTIPPAPFACLPIMGVLLNVAKYIAMFACLPIMGVLLHF